MTRQRLYSIILGLVALIIIGCVNQQPDDSVQHLDTQSTPYEVFVQKILCENLGDGIDIVSILEKHLAQYTSSNGTLYLTADNITDIEYDLERCNISNIDVHTLEDIVIKIDVAKKVSFNAGSAYLHVILAFVFDGNGRFDMVLDEEIIGIASGFNYEVSDVTGDGRDEIVLEIDQSRQGGKEIHILTWDSERGLMSVIFGEELHSGTAIFPCFFENSYRFVPSQSGGQDIVLTSKIYYHLDDILESGSSRFVFDGNKYVVSGTYYDYQARGEAANEPSKMRHDV
ncbi:MAG: hypothetical protein FWG40_07730 [Peptococcaceae bacterium]|nr:hypothetical protein [Peptococcaceae bacterium]